MIPGVKEERFFGGRMTEREIRGLQIFYWSQVIVASLCLCFTLTFDSWANQRGVMETDVKLGLMTIGAWLVGVASVALWTGGVLLFRRILSGADRPAPMNNTRIRRAYTVRVALFQGAAILGLVTLLVGGLLGVLRDHAIFWLMAVPYIVLLLLVFVTFPRRAALQALAQGRS